jgi:hypothetical protein
MRPTKESTSGSNPQQPRTDSKTAYLRLQGQASYLDVSPKTVQRLAVSDPTFPPEIALSPGPHGVRVRSVKALETWVASKRGEPVDGKVFTFSGDVDENFWRYPL